MSGLKLQVMICTHRREGLERVGKMRLPQVEGVGYVVSCQSDPTDIPLSLKRPDVVISFSPTIGLSHNRNHALDMVTAPYAFVADDDLTFRSESLKKIIEIFDSHPALDIATFKSESGDDALFPPCEIDLWQGYKGYNPLSIEIAMRMESVRRASLSFNPHWGLGSGLLLCGEENIFLLSARRKGLSGRFFPIVVASHSGTTTGVRLQQQPGVLKAQGAYIAIRYPFSSPLRLPLKAWRTKGHFFTNLRYILAGAAYAVRHKEELTQ